MGGTPRFPWLWGGPEHQAAFRSALELRYHFLPFMYSLAHIARKHGRPLANPASYEAEFAADSASATAYMVGSVLMPAELGLAHTSVSPPPDENASVVYLPHGRTSRWYRWSSDAPGTYIYVRGKERSDTGVAWAVTLTSRLCIDVPAQLSEAGRRYGTWVSGCQKQCCTCEVGPSYRCNMQLCSAQRMPAECFW
eukprot:m.328386 g.328386  ORF g.328386 m.328386 type:complete len:195 (-) comp27692_c0_seq1:400-984(-)